MANAEAEQVIEGAIPSTTFRTMLIKTNHFQKQSCRGGSSYLGIKKFLGVRKKKKKMDRTKTF